MRFSADCGKWGFVESHHLTIMPATTSSRFDERQSRATYHFLRGLTKCPDRSLASGPGSTRTSRYVRLCRRLSGLRGHSLSASPSRRVITSTRQSSASTERRRRNSGAFTQPRQKPHIGIAVGRLRPILRWKFCTAFIVSLPTRPSAPPVSKPRTYSESPGGDTSNACAPSRSTAFCT